MDDFKLFGEEKSHAFVSILILLNLLFNMYQTMISFNNKS